MTQVRRDLGAWHLQPVNQARLCDMLPTNLQSLAEWSRRSRSALNPSNLADECDVCSLALLFDVSFQILSSTTSVQVINIQGTRGMIIGHVNSTRVKHFVGTKLLQNTGNVSSAVIHNTMEVPASQQNVTQSKRRKVNVPPDPTALFDTWPDGPPPRVAFGVGAPLSYHSVLAPDSLPHTGSRRVTFDEVTLSHPQGQGVADAISTPLQVPPTPALPVSIPTHLVTVGPVPHTSASRFSEIPTCDRPDCTDAATVEIANDRPWPPHQDTTDLDGAVPQQRLSSACSPLPPSTSCGQASPEPLARACPLVAPSELDLLALFAGVVSTTPVVVSTWPTLLTTPSSKQGVFVVPRVNDVAAPTQRLSHVLGGSAAPSRNMPVASSVTTPQAKSSGHGRGSNRSPSPEGAKGKEAMEIDGNDLGHLSHGHELTILMMMTYPIRQL